MSDLKNLREFCTYADQFISTMDDDEVAECGFMPESCHCLDCPYYELRPYERAPEVPGNE